MKANMGKADRIIRMLIAAGLVVLYTSEIVSGSFGFILLVIAFVMLLTSVVSFCPLYVPLGLNTCSTKQKSNN